jgi:hypothetical protein
MIGVRQRSRCHDSEKKRDEIALERQGIYIHSDIIVVHK